MPAIINDAQLNGTIAYFSTLSDQLAHATPDVRKEILRHLEYLAMKAETSTQSILSGCHIKAHDQIITEAMCNIDAVLSIPAPVQSAVPPSSEDVGVAAVIQIAEKSLQGWCSREKSLAIIELISRNRPQVCVEIGVYGGRSLVPAAVALRNNGSGVIYGIETWRPDVAVEHITNDENDAWWKQVNFHNIKTDLYRFIADHGLASQVRIIEAPSADAATIFKSIDYLHIDGAHSTYNAAEDVVLYVKKVTGGGIIIMDDANWETTGPAIAILDSLCDRVQTLIEEGNVTCIVYRKR